MSSKVSYYRFLSVLLIFNYPLDPSKPGQDKMEWTWGKLGLDTAIPYKTAPLIFSVTTYANHAENGHTQNKTNYNRDRHRLRNYNFKLIRRCLASVLEGLVLQIFICSLNIQLSIGSLKVCARRTEMDMGKAGFGYSHTVQNVTFNFNVTTYANHDENGHTQNKRNYNHGRHRLRDGGLIPSCAAAAIGGEAAVEAGLEMGNRRRRRTGRGWTPGRPCRQSYRPRRRRRR
jgi:hypothetical protein